LKTFLQLYQEFAEELTDAPAKFHEFIGYAIVGIILGRKAYFPFGAQRICPNFYITLIAPSSIYRKSTALSIASRVIRSVDHEKILPAEFSQERLIDLLQQTPSGSFFFYEFKTLLGLLEKDYMQGTKAFLTELYDNPIEYTRKTRAAEIRIDNPCISIVSATTMNWFTEMIKLGDMEGGFLNRFIFVPAYKKLKNMPIPPKLDEEKLRVLRVILEDLQKYYNEKEFSMSSEARELYINWFDASLSEIEIQKDDSGYCASATRMQVYLIKFAMINAIVDNHASIISGENMIKAIGLVDWLMIQTKSIIKTEISGNKYEKQLRSVRRVLERNGGECAWSRLLQNSNMKSKELMEIIMTLEERCEIERTFQGDNKHGCLVKLVGKPENA